MATTLPTKAERDARLDTLKASVKKWAQSEINRLDNETLFLKSVLQGRKGVTEAATLNLSAASDIVELEINDYITFEG